MDKNTSNFGTFHDKYLLHEQPTKIVIRKSHQVYLFPSLTNRRVCIYENFSWSCLQVAALINSLIDHERVYLGWVENMRVKY